MPAFDGFIRETETVTDPVAKPFTAEHFENWLASMSRNQTYNWLGHCLYFQYGEHCNVEPSYRAYVVAVDALKRNNGQFGGGEPFRFVAQNRPHTFGGALRRLRTQRHGVFGALRIYFREWRTQDLIRKRG